MTNIKNASHQALGFDPDRASHVRSLRSAVFEPVPSTTLSPDVAPLWNELLPQMEEVAGQPSQPLRPAPPDPSLADPLRQAELLGSATARVKKIAAEQPETPELMKLAELLNEYVALTTELAMRCR
jgi:hypothetical protein